MKKKSISIVHPIALVKAHAPTPPPAVALGLLKKKSLTILHTVTVAMVIKLSIYLSNINVDLGAISRLYMPYFI